jgi:hypothetical protein
MKKQDPGALDYAIFPGLILSTYSVFSVPLWRIATIILANGNYHEVARKILVNMPFVHPGFGLFGFFQNHWFICR